jgi:membrane protein required for colicin V production
MNLLDAIIICTMVFFIVKGLLRGFIREVASLAGVILGILLANHFQPQVTAYLKAYLPSTHFLPLISFALIFLSVLVSCNLLGWALKLLFKKAFLGWVDRSLGLALAVTKGVIITYLVIVLLTFFLPARTPLVADSKLAPLITVSYQSMVRLISPEHYQNLKKRFLGERKEKGGFVPEKGKDLTRKDERE